MLDRGEHLGWFDSPEIVAVGKGRYDIATRAFGSEAAIRRLGLDKPLYEQFLIFLNNALHGDLGTSFVFNEPAIEVILQRLPATLELAFPAAAALLVARASAAVVVNPIICAELAPERFAAARVPQRAVA